MTELSQEDLLQRLKAGGLRIEAAEGVLRITVPTRFGPTLAGFTSIVVVVAWAALVSNRILEDIDLFGWTAKVTFEVIAGAAFFVFALFLSPWWFWWGAEEFELRADTLTYRAGAGPPRRNDTYQWGHIERLRRVRAKNTWTKMMFNYDLPPTIGAPQFLGRNIDYLEAEYLLELFEKHRMAAVSASTHHS